MVSTDALKEKVDLKGLLPDQLRRLMVELGEKEYRAGQILSWVHGKGAKDVGDMTDLGKGLRQRLGEVAYIGALKQVDCQESNTGQAVKFLFELPSGHRIESVLIIDGKRRTVCLSSQVGCALACRFCATGKMGFLQNLSAGEIVDQLLQVNHYLAESRGERATNIVMMGMGEPLLNYENLVPALRLMRMEHGPAVGGRRITVSTAGYLPGIQRLAAEDLNIGLAISLNATTDEIRQRIMPINRKWKIADLIKAARDFYDQRGRRVTFEYVLLDGITDADEDALRLASLTRGFPSKINLIPYNELGEDSEFRRPPAARVARFRTLLEEHSPMAVTLRESRGRDIDAACGQLFHQSPEPAAAVVSEHEF
jgi:23S rRNA (adenine2503-C2)-methyltransferase